MYQYLTDIVNLPNLLKYKEMIKTKDKQVWEKEIYNKLGRLLQGFKTIKGKNIIFFISKTKVPKNKKVTYTRIVCTICP